MLNLRSLVKAHKMAVQSRARLGIKGLVAKDEGETGTLYLYDQIGGDSFNEGITAIAVVEALDAMQAKGCKAVDVRIDSEGGDVFEGKSIFEALKRCPMAVTTHNDSIAASAASFIAMAGSKIVSAPHATWMIHRAWSLAMGNAEDLVHVSEILALEDGNIAAMYAAQTGKTADECLALMSSETWMNAQQAKDSGFCDEIARDEAGEEEGADNATSASAKAVLGIATATQERIRQHVQEVLARQKKTLAQHTRASPGPITTPQRPAARK